MFISSSLTLRFLVCIFIIKQEKGAHILQRMEDIVQLKNQLFLSVFMKDAMKKLCRTI